MATDARGHTAPASGETPRRQAINDLSLSINDVVVVANATARAQKVADVVAAGHTWPRPLYVHRQDAATGGRLEVTTDGTTWRAITQASGIALGTTNQFGQIAVPHGLGYTPTRVSAVLGSDYLASTVNASYGVPETTSRDYTATVYNITATDIIVQLANMRVPTWAGAGVKAAIVWSAS